MLGAQHVAAVEHFKFPTAILYQSSYPAVK
jgi:hypothetical protein